MSNGLATLRRLVAGFPTRRPRFESRLGHVGFVVGKVALGQVFPKHFGFPCQFSFHRLLHTHHLSSGSDGHIAFSFYSLDPFLFYLTVSSFFFFHFDHFTAGRTPWASDQFVAGPLSKHRTTRTQNKHIHIQDIHALCGIRTNDPGFRAGEDSSCLRYKL
jgi:hypothetical protein